MEMVTLLLIIMTSSCTFITSPQRINLKNHTVYKTLMSPGPKQWFGYIHKLIQQTLVLMSPAQSQIKTGISNRQLIRKMLSKTKSILLISQKVQLREIVNYPKQVEMTAINYIKTRKNTENGKVFFH